jgi:hypothetical protein
MSEIYSKLANIQKTLKAPKGQFNTFGNYHYRSCEDILESVKPLLGDMVLTITDTLEMIGNRYYIKATVILSLENASITVCAYAREEETKKGMDGAQVTGAASSYARKYALNGLFLIDDTKDADTRDNTDKKEPPVKQPPMNQAPPKAPVDTTKDLAKEINIMLLEMEGNEHDASLKLIELSGFMGKNKDTGEAKWVDGKGDPKEFSAKMLPVAYGKVQKAYKAWQEEGGMIE